jgi:hypothetical protein
MNKNDVTQEQLGKWDTFVGKQPTEIEKAVFDHANDAYKKIKEWYWLSVTIKRRTALVVRWGTYILAVVGTVLPIVAALITDKDKQLICTQGGVISLAVAALLQLADRVFGWSSGWLRYMKAITQIEEKARQFQLDWGAQQIKTTNDMASAQILYNLAYQFVADLMTIQSDETAAWITEFDSGTTALGEAIRAVRDVADKNQLTIGQAITSNRPGALQITLSPTITDPVQITFNAQQETLTGNSWTKTGITPGIYEAFLTTIGSAARSAHLAVVIEADKVTKETVALQ